MKARSWNDVIDMVRRDDNGKWDAEKKAKDLWMNSDGKLVLQGNGACRTIGLTDHAFTQMCGKLELPARYMRRIPGELRAKCFNNDLEARAGEGKNFLLRCKGDMARAFLSEKYSRIDNSVILEIFEKLARGFQHQVRSFHLDEHGCWMKILIDDLRTWDPSDRVSELKVGLLLGNSEVGCRAVTVEPFVYRLACTNDAVIQQEDAINIRHVHLKARELRGRVAESMNTALKGGGGALEAFTRAYEEEIENPADIIKKLAEKHGMTQETTDQVLLGYASEPHESRFGVINAFSHVAQKLEGDARVEMERFAGSLLARKNLASA